MKKRAVAIVMAILMLTQCETGTGLYASELQGNENVQTMDSESVSEELTGKVQTQDQTRTYTITYDLAGGKFTKTYPKTFLSTSGDVRLVAPERTGYLFEGWYTDKNFNSKVTKISAGTLKDVKLYAKWSAATYRITYIVNGGKNSSKNPSTYTYAKGVSSFGKPTRSGYTFGGWYADSKFKTKITKISTTNTGDIKLYAKWTLSKYKITYKLSGGKNNSKNPSTYSSTGNAVTLKAPTRSGYAFVGWYSDSKYKNKVTSIKKGSKGDITLYAKWEKEYKATTSSAKITSYKPSKKNTITIKATISKRIKSSDTKYYLVTVDTNNKVLKKVAGVEKANKVTFNVDVSKDRGLIQSQYAVAVKQSGKYVRISAATKTITNPEKLAVITTAYKKGATKKGIQSTDINAVTQTGADNIFMNINVSTLLSNAASEPVKYTYKGKKYTFGNLGGYVVAVQNANKKKVNVTMQILLDAPTLDIDKNLIAAEARVPGHLYYAWNTKDKAATDKMEAIFSYLAEHFGGKDCYVSNWIIGNEVNADDVWNYRGSMSDSAFITSYTKSFRALYNAVRGYRANSKVFICVDNMWNRPENENSGFNSREFIDKFASEVKKQQSGVEWNLAYHPYSVRIDYPAFWDPNSYYDRADLVNDTVDTQFVIMKNLNVLTNYVKNKYGSDHRIIISEVGFEATDPTKQAAALAYSYNIAAANSMIDAFIIRSYVDEAGDGAYKFGISGREAYDVFKNMDTKNAEKYTNKYLGTIGISSWSSAIPGYSISRITSNK